MGQRILSIDRRVRPRICHLRVAILRRGIRGRRLRARIRSSSAALGVGIGGRPLLVVRWVEEGGARGRGRLERWQRVQWWEDRGPVHGCVRRRCCCCCLWAAGRRADGGAEVRCRLAGGIWGALRRGHGVHLVQQARVLGAAWTCDLETSGRRGTGRIAGGRRGALSVVGALGAEGFIRRRGRGAAAPVAVVDVVLHVSI